MKFNRADLKQTTEIQLCSRHFETNLLFNLCFTFAIGMLAMESKESVIVTKPNSNASK